ncbi:MAG: hypothetical protein AN481_11135 [Aphanizomenon flos-aquae LD13]|jgi:hypothetical protein|uniref:YtkA-like domain-containing protein n=1 Tax=Aphanizomenon flos-aquae LD13 TaxID=1710894 RepID=A0A1B7VWA9_APHFL|nr:hypothetical protein [Aphanizomenon flos-aquae UKL13-PB]MBO1060903.1 hypothetical protein [Aphanizomenon flos-aquae CP01]OBQ25261.1 MAG: hypothetical protein AN481_11135 [Aphanizomenon flos-aquae LD13]HCQ21226.1 hypothetical protein [Anabaena sp. UBA12330]
MKRFFPSILVMTTLLIAPGCLSNTKSTKSEVSPSMMMNHDGNSINEHEGHSMENKHHTNNSQITTKVKLTAPQKLAPNQPINLVIDIQDSTGNPVNKFEIFQEKLMHLIVVSDDLRFFDHIHPEYKEKGRFEVNANFPESGNYTLFSDYKPTGNKEMVSLMNITIPGTIPLPKNLEKFTKTKIISDTKVNLNISTPKIKAGQEIKLTFDLKDQKNQPIKDLQPYLGKKGHLVIIKSSSPLTVSDYIHAHALENSIDGKIEFHTKLPKQGTYKMWVQFNRNGQVKTADFWVNVE